MSTPIVVDARDGLSHAALDVFREAELVAITAVDQTTAAIGCWAAGEQEPRLVLVQGRDLGTLNGATIRDTGHDLWWQFLMHGCRPGDVALLEWWGTRLGLSLSGAGSSRSDSDQPSTRNKPPALLVGDAHSGRARNFPIWDATLRRRPRVGESNIMTHTTVLA